VAVAVAEPGRNGKVRFIGNVANKSAAVMSLLRKLERKHGALACAYEAGPCCIGCAGSSFVGCSAASRELPRTWPARWGRGPCLGRPDEQPDPTEVGAVDRRADAVLRLL
jgi:hypothetical protein